MSFWDTPQLDEAQPIAKSTGFWDTPVKTPDISITPRLGNMPMPAMSISGSTQAVPDETTPNITPKTFWDMGVKAVTPRKEPVDVRRPFESTPIKTTLPPIVTGLASFGTGIVEAIPKGASTLYGEATRGGNLFGMDQRRLGFDTPEYQTASKEVTDAIDKGENPWQAGLRVMSTKTLDVAFGAQLFSGIAKTLTAQLLRGDLASRVTAQDIVDGYKARQSATFEQLKTAPLSVREKALADLANAKTEADKVIAKYGAPTPIERARVATARYTEPLARETPIVGNVFKPTKAEVGSYPSRMAKPDIGMKPVVGGGFWDTPIAGLLPGERPIGGKAPQPAFGLSIQPVEKVGGESPDLFARKATALENKSPTAKSRGYESVPEKQGYDKVFKPYGAQGAGYYYAPKAVEPTATGSFWDTPKAELPAPTSDTARIQELKNSIQEGKNILQTGTINGRKLSEDELRMTAKSVENAQAKIGEETKNGYKIQEISSDQIFNAPKTVTKNDSTKEGLRKWNILVGQGKAEFIDGKYSLKTTSSSPLTTDPRKYETAEEFVKGQGETIYRVGKPTDLTKGKDRGISFATEKGVAERFVKNDSYGSPRIGGVLDEFILPQSARILDANTVTTSVLKNDFIGFSKEDAIVKYARREGYDAIDFTKSLVSDSKLKGTWMPEKEIRIINPDVLKTRSQLTDIWNRAHKTRNNILKNYERAKKIIPAKVTSGGITGGKGRGKLKGATFEEIAPTKSTSPLGRILPPQETKVSPQQKEAPKQDIQVPQKSEKGGIVAPVRSEKPLQKAYTPKEQKAIQGIADNFKEPITRTQKRLDTLRKIKDDVVEFIQNKETRVLKLVEQKGVKITDSSDPYLKATLYPGKVDTLIKTGHAEGQAIVNEAKTLATSLKKDLADVRKEVNEFLIARHAPERNLALEDKAAGMSTAEATAKLEAIKNSPQGAEIAKIADKVQDLNNKVLDILRDGGVISDELYTTLRTKYTNHVPLNRIFEETDDFAGALSGTGFNVRATGIKKAVGSQREVSDILGNVLHNYEQAVLRSEKNIVDNATLAFVRANESSLFEVIKPKMIGTDFAGKPLMETTTDPSILQMFENGKKIWIKINDPKLAIALQGVGKEKLGTILNAVGSFTRLYAGLATRFNPEFALPNKIRDLQETMVYLASRSEVGGKGAFETVTKDPQSMKDVVDFLRGKDTPGAKLYAEMRSMGGTTGGFGLSTKAKVEMDIKTMEALANSKTRKVVKNLVEYVDNWNTIFEDSTRLSVYKQALEQGLSKERAAFLAKEASINFNRMGKGGPVVNALYMFSNASIQGSAKVIRAMKNPKVAATVVTVVGVAVASANEWNDQADPEWRDKVPKWDRLNGLPFVIPSTDGTFRYVTIPVSWGIKPIKVSADFAYDMMSGIDYSAKEVAGTLMTTVLESYNPIGGTDMTSALAPTILDVPFDISRNKSWTGNMIKPDFDKNAPEDIKYFESLKKTSTGRTAISLTEMLQQNAEIAISPADMKYAFDSYIGGAGRSITKTGNVLGGLVTGKPIPADEYPFISRFYRESQPEETVGKSSEDISALLGEQSRENFKAKQEAISYYDWLKGLPKERANAELDALDIRNPKLADRVTNLLEEDQLGLSYADKQIKQLQVNNGSRAQYIFDKAMNIKTPEERNAYLDDLRNKKIITNNIETQLIILIENRNKK